MLELKPKVVARLELSRIGKRNRMLRNTNDRFFNYIATILI